MAAALITKQKGNAFTEATNAVVPNRDPNAVLAKAFNARVVIPAAIAIDKVLPKNFAETQVRDLNESILTEDWVLLHRGR